MRMHLLSCQLFTHVATKLAEQNMVQQTTTYITTINWQPIYCIVSNRHSALVTIPITDGLILIKPTFTV